LSTLDRSHMNARDVGKPSPGSMTVPDTKESTKIGHREERFPISASLTEQS